MLCFGTAEKKDKLEPCTPTLQEYLSNKDLHHFVMDFVFFMQLRISQLPCISCLIKLSLELFI